MTIEIRHCRDREELAEYGRIVSYVFASSEGMDEELATTQPDWTHCAFVDGKMAATMGVFPFTVRLNGAPVAMGGVTAVGTLPQHRRKGLLRGIMRQGLETMRERGQSIAILWASMGAIYQRFGYGLATSTVNYSFDPRFASFERAVEIPGEITLHTPEEALPLMKPVYVEYATPRNLLIHRSMPLWQLSVLRPRKKGEPVHVAIYRELDGRPTGYVVYEAREERPPTVGGEQVIEVKDFVALDIEAYRALWEFVRRHDLAWRIDIRNRVPEDDPAPLLLLEPRVLNRQIGDGIWMRIVDVAQALPQRPYSERGDLRIAIEGDELCPWNAGTYLLSVNGEGRGEVMKVDDPPDLVMRPNALATLVAGHRPASQLARAGLIGARDERLLALADRLFATAHPPYCPDGF